MVLPCVFDADVTRTRQAEKLKYEQMLYKYSKNPSVIFCDSMPSIELWFLLHFLKTNRYFESSEEVIKSLRKYLPEFNKHQSFLSRENWVVELIRDDRLRIAISNARGIGVEGESYSNLHRLFERLE